MKKIAAAFVIILALPSSSYSAEKLTLKDSIGIAKSNSESIAIARSRVEAAQALAGQAFSAFLPTLKLDASLGRGYQQSPPFFSAADSFSPGFPATDTIVQFEGRENETFAYSAGITQNLFAGGRIWNTYLAADLGAAAAMEDYRSEEMTLTYNVISAYYSVIKAKRALELSQESLEMALKHLEQTKVMYSSGVVTRADILRTELEGARAELALTRAKSGADIADNSFNMAIGRRLDEPVTLYEDDFKMGEMTAPDYAEFLSIAYKERPEWRIARLGRDIAEKGSLASYSGYMPAILLSGSYGYNDYKDVDAEIDKNLKNWNVALIGSWTIFDGFGTPNKVKEAYAKYVEAAKNRDLLEKSIAIDVKNACSFLNAAVEEVKLAGKALELADENWRIAELRYTSGVGTNIEALDAKTMLTSARLDLLQAEFNYELAKAAVNKAVGKEVFIEVGEKPEGGAEPEIVLHGTAQYIPLEGGFVGFFDEAGNRYDLLGEKAAGIGNVVGVSDERKKIKIIGRIKRGIVTVHMWGTPFEVTAYEWEK